ncbi:T9SS type A sorting domain-containing protein [Pontibacter sp. G13]|uniref:T9SS type A sorting domain-containing protein n=1 Tax=Pontibacter sp. G13 TaxID=3074898 RepID=UPI00288BEB23|nr:T9SS type A sorting domain-containing protein [Pontibacter sp. G13]WNJ18200.1 T9SS type A sorting domain-containing protein [Pontibacter sp. G13]
MWCTFPISFKELISLCASLILFQLYLFAEGTDPLVPSGSSSSCVTYIQGNDGTGKEGSTYGRPRTDLIHVHIEDPDNETIYVGFTKLEPNSQEIYYQILTPDSTVLCTGVVADHKDDAGYINDNGVEAYVGPTQIYGNFSGGYDAIECSPTVAGDYLVMFNVGDAETPANLSTRYYLHPFDITVADISDEDNPQEVTGRVFSNNWHLNTASSSNQACMTFFAYTPDSMVVSVDMNGFQPYGFTVAFNSYGVQSTGDIEADRKSTTTFSADVAEYPVFLHSPDEDAYPTGTPGEVTYVTMTSCESQSGYEIVVETSKSGEINVFIDLDGTDGYQSGGTDVYFPYEIPGAGKTAIPWDGLDGAGNEANPESGEVIVQFLGGIVHFPIWDPENNANGFNCSIIRPSGLDPLMYFDNSNTDIATSNLDGCSGGCNVWTGNSGDKVMINTWMNTILNSDTAEIGIDVACDPVPIADSTCYQTNKSRQVAILANDTDPDNLLDSSSVTLSNVSPSGASLNWDAESKLLSFTPATDNTSTLSLTYEICDLTPESLGGARCATAQLVIEWELECLAATSLDLAGLDLQFDGKATYPILNWTSPDDDRIKSYIVFRTDEWGVLNHIAELSADSSAHYRFQDRDWRYQMGVETRYQIVGIGRDGGFAKSEIMAFEPSERARFQLSMMPNPASDFVEIRVESQTAFQLTVFSTEGKEIFKESHAYGVPHHPFKISVKEWQAGMYSVSIQNAHMIDIQKLIIP